ncbi:CAP domain-containing protein [Priestia koreensis]|uniref:CAP domain-containing protein n=1 Tax=Priestia koreensis TaxID=284581 RepID=UPI00203D0681|nr:CAP domain-containing protein [Priestia koreensis]MCM3005708.1 CAP domain-containing protein [Priestia koreensis]
MKKWTKWGVGALMTVSVLLGNGQPSSAAETSTDTYKDYRANAYWSEAMKWGIEKGITEGYKTDEGMLLKPDLSITEAQYLAFLIRYVDGEELAQTTSSSSNWSASVYKLAQKYNLSYQLDKKAQSLSITRGKVATILAEAMTKKRLSKEEAVQWMYDQHITVEYGSQPTYDSFQPNTPISRGQIMTFLYRLDQQPIEKSIGLVLDLTLQQEEKQVGDMVNSERSKVGEKPLIIDPVLSAIARIKAQDMALNGYFAHLSPTYGKEDELIKMGNVPYFSRGMYGENIALGYHTAESVMDGWMNSPSHHDNIMDHDYSHIGIGLFEWNGRKYWVQEFFGRTW